MKKTLYFLLFLSLMAPGQAMAEKWRLDTAHSNFFFEVRHTYAAVRGQFGAFSGDVIFDPASPEKSRFDFTIKVDSVDTRIGKRDTHLRTPEFFDAKKYPEITFRSTRVTKAGDNKYIVDGKLTIKNVTKDLSLVFNYHGQKINPLKPGEVVSGFDTTLSIDRLAYRVGDGKFSKMGVVSKDVDILVTLELLRDK
ncbi:MAG: YceI family protein [Thermodesulfobacteriota bacterium]